MARCLIVGCGCRGQSLTRELRMRGHAVRGTTRSAARSGDIEAAGGEAFVGDPDRIGTLVPALAHVGVACLLLGSAAGSPEQLVALHHTRLDMLMEKMLDTTVRAVVYEVVGTVPDEVLAVGAERVRHWCDRSLIPYVLLDADPGNAEQWTQATADAVERGLLAYGQLG